MGTGEKDDLDDVDPAEVKAALESGENSPVSPVADMLQAAVRQTEDYHAALEESVGLGFVGGELGDMLNQSAIQPQFAEEVAALRIPQFFLKTVPDLFGDGYELLEKENLSDGFSLSGQDVQISFELATGEIYRIDLQEQGEAIPQISSGLQSGERIYPGTAGQDAAREEGAAMCYADLRTPEQK